MEDRYNIRLEKLVVGIFLLFFSLVSISSSIYFIKNSKTVFNPNDYETTSSTINEAHLEYYGNGKVSNKKLLVYLSSFQEIRFEFKGYSKDMVDDRYFVNKKNWINSFTITYKKNDSNIKEVFGLAVNGKEIFTAKNRFIRENSNSIEKAIVLVIIGLNFLYLGLKFSIKNWNYKN